MSQDQECVDYVKELTDAVVSRYTLIQAGHPNAAQLLVENEVDEDLRVIVYQIQCSAFCNNVCNTYPRQTREFIYMHLWSGRDFVVCVDDKAFHWQHGPSGARSCDRTEIAYWVNPDVVGHQFATEAAEVYYPNVDYRQVPVAQLGMFLKRDHFHLPLTPAEHLRGVGVEVSTEKHLGLTTSPGGHVSRRALTSVHKQLVALQPRLRADFSLHVKLGKGCDGPAIPRVLERLGGELLKLRQLGTEVRVSGRDGRSYLLDDDVEAVKMDESE
ncbi:hypothetical protein K491DRAFT_709977 [Lophiostoma macrostomum CBS 122681]|uniref:Uncharacterized protein n=1 Tax=Lophiostoma macrostomum CBS 122681 TaxID=1314788 RepID=A0A6A6TUI7_9PLEO|nr:hypothetical protein K491DRAFT_709977 [Lophiostoma macrostomum CBS 122681]